MYNLQQEIKGCIESTSDKQDGCVFYGHVVKSVTSAKFLSAIAKTYTTNEYFFGLAA